MTKTSVLRSAVSAARDVNAASDVGIASNVSAASELTEDELGQISGGLSFLGGLGSVGAGGNLGKIGTGAGLAQGGPNGDFYGTVYGGGNTVRSAGTSGGILSNVVFGYGNHTFDDVVTGGSTVVDFGFGSVSYNENGFTVGLGRTGFGVSHSDTTNLTQYPGHPDIQPALDALNHPDGELPPPQLKDWSGSFGPNEAGPAFPPAHTTSDIGNTGTQDPMAVALGINDIGTHSDTPHDSNADHAAQGSSTDPMAVALGINDIGTHSDIPHDSNTDHAAQASSGDHSAQGSSSDPMAVALGINDIGTHSDTPRDSNAAPSAQGSSTDPMAVALGINDISIDHGTTDSSVAPATTVIPATTIVPATSSDSTVGNDFGDPNAAGSGSGGVQLAGDFGSDDGGGDFSGDVG